MKIALLFTLFLFGCKTENQEIVIGTSDIELGLIKIQLKQF